jgi:cytochrome c oxidase subunit III
MIMEDTTTQRGKSRPNHKAELRVARRKAAKPMMYLAIVSMVMLFAGLTSAYVVRAGSGNWLVFRLPDIAILSTAVIITSSLTMLIAQRATRKDNHRLASAALFATLALGIVFFFTQIEGWRQLTAQGIYFVGKYSNASGSFLYIIAMVHLLHMSGGIIALTVSFTKSVLKKYSSADHLGLDLTAIYWHFLDLLWVYLFLFLYYYR